MINFIIKKFIKNAKYIPKNIEMDIKKDIISMNADVEISNRKEYFVANQVDIENVRCFDFLNPKEFKEIIINVIVELLSNFKLEYIIMELEENVKYGIVEPNRNIKKIISKIYIQNISYEFIKMLKNKKNNLKFKHIKFMSEIISSVYIGDIKTFLSKPIENIYFNKKNNENIYKLYTDYNNFGFCVLSNEPFFLLPTNPELKLNVDVDLIKQYYQDNIFKLNNYSTDLSNKKIPINLFVKTNSCIDLDNNVLMITKYNNIKSYLSPNNIIKCCNLTINDSDYIKKINSTNDIETDEYFVDLKKKFIIFIKMIETILIDKYIKILCDTNKLETKYIIDILDLNLNTNLDTNLDLDLDLDLDLEQNEIKIIKDEYIDLFNSKKHQELIILGQYIKNDYGALTNNIDDIKNQIENINKNFNRRFERLNNIDKLFNQQNSNTFINTINKITTEHFKII